MMATWKRALALAAMALAAPLQTSAVSCGIDLSCAMLCLDDTNITTYADGTIQQQVVAMPTAAALATHALAVNTSFWQRINSLGNSTQLSIRPDSMTGAPPQESGLSFISLQATIEPNLLNCSMKTGVCTKVCKYDQNIETTIVNFNYLMDFFDSIATPRLVTLPCAARSRAYATFLNATFRTGLIPLARKYAHFDLKNTEKLYNVTNVTNAAVDKFITFVNDTNKPFGLAAAVCNADSAMKLSANLNGCAITSNVLSYSLYARQCACNISDVSPPSPFEGRAAHMPELNIPRTNSPWHGWLYSALAALERVFLPISHQHAYYLFGGDQVYTLYDAANLTTFEECMGTNGDLCLAGPPLPP